LHLLMYMCYTEFVTTPDAQSDAGVIHIIILLAQLVFNLYFVLKAMFHQIKLCIIKAFIRITDDPEARKLKAEEERRAEKDRKKV